MVGNIGGKVRHFYLDETVPKSNGRMGLIEIYSVVRGGRGTSMAGCVIPESCRRHAGAAMAKRDAGGAPPS